MSDDGQVWLMRRGGQVIAELAVTGGDFPWLNATLLPLPGFEEIRPLFEEERRAFGHIDGDLAYERIRAAVTLHYPDGRPVSEFLLHIGGQDA